MTDTRVPSTAFADAWIQVDRTEDPGFLVQLLDSTRAQLLERARRSPAEFFAPLDIRPGHRVLDVGCGTGNLSFALPEAANVSAVTGIDQAEAFLEAGCAQTQQ